MCMPCSKDPERVQRAEDYLKELKQAKVINRTLADQPSEDPYSILWRFQSRVNIDGLDQTDEEELVEVLH